MKKHDLLVFTDAKNNNHKYYDIVLEDDDSINVTYGRTDVTAQKASYIGGIAKYNSIIKSKIAKGYELSNIVSVDKSVGKGELKAVAHRDLLGDTTNPKLISLVNQLIAMNKHQIMSISGGNMKVDDDGLIKTSLGLVTLDSIEKAGKILTKIKKEIKSSSDLSVNTTYSELLSSYLKLIPQKVPSQRGWDVYFFTQITTIDKQEDFLEQLKSSLELYEQKVKTETQKTITDKKIFNFQVDLLDDKKIFDKIQQFFNSTVNSRHTSKSLKLKNVYVLNNKEQTENFNKTKSKIGNVRELWHGTRTYNVLSILKNGLIVPKSNSGINITGRMFGDGVYFSDQSTKSLNYSSGYWDGYQKDNHCFMFLADVAMGKEYNPDRPGGYRPKDCHSIFAKAGKSGVMNNEMIVPELEQIQLKYLCEFSE